MSDNDRGDHGGLDELRVALAGALATAGQQEVRPTGLGLDAYLTTLAAARRGTDLEEASHSAMRAATYALTIGDVHAMNGLVCVANTAAAVLFTTWAKQGRQVEASHLADLNLTRAWLAVKTAEAAASAAIAAAK